MLVIPFCLLVPTPTHLLKDFFLFLIQVINKYTYIIPPSLFLNSYTMSETESTGALNPKDEPLPSTSSRPSASGTELGLRANREKASSAFQRAWGAEQAYRAKRRATYARRDIQSAKEHFEDARVSFKAGMVCAWNAARAGPAVIREKREQRRAKAEAKKREKAAEKKKMWGEKVRRATEGSEEEVAPAEETPAA